MVKSLTIKAFYLFIYLKEDWIYLNKKYSKTIACHRSARLHHQSVTTISITWVLIHVTCTSLITQSTQHYKGTHPTPALCPISIIRSGLSPATRYDLPDTYLFRNLPPVPPPRGFLCLPRLSPLVCQLAAIDLGCVLLLVIHEFLARQSAYHSRRSDLDRVIQHEPAGSIRGTRG